MNLQSSREPSDNLCWICQQSIETGGINRTWIDEEVSLPIHTNCWQTMTPEVRAQLAYQAKKDSGLAARTLQEAIQAFLHALKDHQGGTDLPFMRN